MTPTEFRRSVAYACCFYHYTPPRRERLAAWARRIVGIAACMAIGALLARGV